MTLDSMPKHPQKQAFRHIASTMMTLYEYLYLIYIRYVSHSLSYFVHMQILHADKQDRLPALL